MAGGGGGGVKGAEPNDFFISLNFFCVFLFFYLLIH